MNKNKPKVEFYGKQMNLLEARLYSCGLRMRIIDITLNEDDKINYDIWKERKEKANRRTEERIFKKINESQYLVEELENQIRATKNQRKRIHCEKYGHKEKKGSSDIKLSLDGTRAHVLCSKCNAMYERAATNEELEKAKNKIYNPFRD